MIILDTHVLLWMDRNDMALGAQARRCITDAWQTEGIAVSAISFWEAALLAQRGRITLPVTAETWRMDLLHAGVAEIPLDGKIALMAASMLDFHKDPADRFIVSSAIVQAALLVTADSEILTWAGELRTLDARI